MKYSFKHSIRWSIFIFSLTFVLGCIFSVTSTMILEGVTWGIGVLIVFFIVLIGIVFDMMGIASAAASEQPFRAMGSVRVNGAKQAIYIVRNADRVSSFCNDVIGDICGIISGAATAIVVLKLFQSSINSEFVVYYTVVNVIFMAFVSALTVGGKAAGKSMSIAYATTIVLWMGKFFYFLEQRLSIKVLNGKKNKNIHRKRGKKHAAR